MIHKRLLRVKYSKTGLTRFLGHLDILRLMTRAIARSSIPVMYSQGFSPHMKVSFGPSLPLGITSDCEYLDIATDEAESSGTTENWTDELRKYMPEGIYVKTVELLAENAPSLADAINRALYEITIPKEYSPEIGKLARFLQMEKIVVEKASKDRIIEVDIRPSVEKLNTIDNQDGDAKVIIYELVTVIGQAAYATPALVLKYLLERDWQGVPGLTIHRKELYSVTGAQ
jgi:radical SAM-linked protein